MMKHAVLATDLSKASEKIIENALELKSLGIEKISLVSVYKSLKDVFDLEEIEIRGLVNPEDSEKKLEAQKNKLVKAGFEVEAVFIFGTPAIVLRDIVDELKADILIIGSHGYSQSDSVIGSTAYELLNNVKKPVLMLVLNKIDDPKKRWELLCNKIADHVLLPTDFSDFAEEAFQLIKGIKNHIPELTLMHIQDEVKLKDHLESKISEFNEIDSARLNRMKTAFKKAHPETKVNIVIEYGKPKQKILDFINNKTENKITLTVMGSQGRGYLERFFLGSISHQVSRHSDSNVLLVPIIY